MNGEIMSPMTYSGASCSSTKSAASARSRFLRRGDRLDQQRMLRDREDVRAVRLAVPARDARQAVRDILDLDVERRGIEQVEPATRQHALPGARRGVLDADRGPSGLPRRIAKPSRRIRRGDSSRPDDR